MLQIGLVYFFGGIAKIYPDWLNAIPAKLFLSSKTNYPLIGMLFTKEWFAYLLSYGGIFFDLLIVPFLLLKRTRFIAFCFSIFFHLFNAIVFQVGIFPFLSLAFTLFFFEPKTIRNIFLKNKPLYELNEIRIPDYKKYLIPLMAIYFCIQLALPLRHWFIKGDVLFTEEGHRLSWRMMLRTKSGQVKFTVIDKKSNEKKEIKLDEYVSKKQLSALNTKPDLIWQFAQRLKKEAIENEQDVAVYVKGIISVNGRPYQDFINDTVDLSSVKWNQIKHNTWILPFKNNVKTNNISIRKVS